jgi:hypothetical protein
MFLPINDQHAGQQLDFVAEKLECNGARQKGRIHENTLPEWHLVRDRPRLVKDQTNRGICWAQALSGKPDLDVRNGQPGLVNHDCRNIAAAGCESHLPRPVASAAMLNALVEYDVASQRQQER